MKKLPIWLVEEGQIIRGTVCVIADFGLFIELVPRQLDGLLLYDRTPYREIAENAKIGDGLDVVVAEINDQTERVRLELLPDSTRYEAFWKSEATPNG